MTDKRGTISIEDGYPSIENWLNSVFRRQTKYHCFEIGTRVRPCYLTTHNNNPNKRIYLIAERLEFSSQLVKKLSDHEVGLDRPNVCGDSNTKILLKTRLRNI